MINLEGAKKYVGGHFEESGRKQFNFLVSQGLKPYHYFLDCGCGCFRAGKLFIDYLDIGHYCGIDQHKWLMDVGIDYVLNDSWTEKKPLLAFNADFDFRNFSKEGVSFDFVLAKSVFTHLTSDKIKQCLNSLKSVIKKDGIFFASIFVGDSSKNRKVSDDTRKFMYSLEEIKKLADGWEVEELGNDGCYRQTMLKFQLIK